MKAAGAHRIENSTTDGKQQLARFAMATDFLAMGRAGEVSKTTFADQQMDWDYTHKALFVDWGMVKVGMRKPMGYVADYDSMELDFYHSACAFMFYRKLVAGSDWLFPTMSGLKEPANKMTTLVKELSGKVAGFTDKCNATSLRLGACNEALASPGTLYHRLLHSHTLTLTHSHSHTD